MSDYFFPSCELFGSCPFVFASCWGMVPSDSQLPCFLCLPYRSCSEAMLASSINPGVIAASCRACRVSMNFMAKCNMTMDTFASHLSMEHLKGSWTCHISHTFPVKYHQPWWIFSAYLSILYFLEGSHSHEKHRWIINHSTMTARWWYVMIILSCFLESLRFSRSWSKRGVPCTSSCMTKRTQLSFFFK